jgi:L-threonylcarbamoyladenylate synthase
MNDYQKALNALLNGGIVIYPTDTAYGIGCRLSNIDAVERLYEIRRRPLSKAVPLLVGSISMAKKYFAGNLPEKVVGLMQRYWPGGLTVINYCRKYLIPSNARAGKDTVGLRMPDNEDLINLINALGEPVLGPSANFSGEPTPYEYQAVDKELQKKADFVLKGNCKTMMASTVIDCTNNFQILRQGSVRLEI